MLQQSVYLVCSALWLVSSLHSSSQLDINVKGAMIRDLLNMAGYMLPDKDDVVTNPPSFSNAGYGTVRQRLYNLIVILPVLFSLVECSSIQPSQLCPVLALHCSSTQYMSYYVGFPHHADSVLGHSDFRAGLAWLGMHGHWLGLTVGLPAASLCGLIPSCSQTYGYGMDVIWVSKSRSQTSKSYLHP